MEFIFKGKKHSKDANDALADILEEYDFNLDEGNLETFMKYAKGNKCQKVIILME